MASFFYLSVIWLFSVLFPLLWGKLKYVGSPFSFWDQFSLWLSSPLILARNCFGKFLDKVVNLGLLSLCFMNCMWYLSVVLGILECLAFLCFLWGITCMEPTVGQGKQEKGNCTWDVRVRLPNNLWHIYW